MKTVTEVGKIIEGLTENEDLRQDLWLRFLSGNPVDSLSVELARPSIEDDQDPIVRHAMWRMLKQPLSESLLRVIDNLSEFERSIVFMLMLGLTPEKISKYKGISEVRIRQAISAIRYNKSWTKYYGEGLQSE